MATAHQIRDLIAQTTTGRPFHFLMVEVGFSHVRNRARRHYLNNLPTSFVLMTRQSTGCERQAAKCSETRRSSSVFSAP